MIRLPRVQEKTQTRVHVQSYLEELRNQGVTDGMPQNPSSCVTCLAICCLFDEAVTNINIQRRIVNDNKM
jgi:hypothetical protein